MINYKDMSDFEISKKVGDFLRVEWAGLDQNYHPLSIWSDGGLREFDPCNNPADAWTIIVENKISLFCVEVNRHETTWRSTARQGRWRFIDVKNKNPLRAAMIVFLMMKDAEK